MSVFKGNYGKVPQDRWVSVPEVGTFDLTDVELGRRAGSLIRLESAYTPGDAFRTITSSAVWAGPAFS